MRRWCVTHERRKKSFKNRLFVILTVVIVLFIMVNALLSYNNSHLFSGWLAGFLGMDDKGAVENGDFVLRKVAHIIEYALLGAVIQWGRDSFEKQNKKTSVWLPLFTILSMGVLDEFFQGFRGRGSAVSDVLLDFAGGLLGMLMVMCLCKWIKNKKAKNISGGKRNE